MTWMLFAQSYLFQAFDLKHSAVLLQIIRDSL